MRAAAPSPAGLSALTGVAQAALDVEPLWQAEDEGPDGWDRSVQLLKSTVDGIVAAAADALTDAGLGVSASESIGCAVGTFSGLSYVAEAIHERVSRAGPAWIDPESFVYYAPHAVAATACLQLRLRGDTVTLLGPAAGHQALTYALRGARLGRHDVWLCGAYELPTRFAARRLGEAGVRVDPRQARAVFLVVETQEHAERRGATPIGLVGASSAADSDAAPRCVAELLRASGLRPEDIGHVRTSGEDTGALAATLPAATVFAEEAVPPSLAATAGLAEEAVLRRAGTRAAALVVSRPPRERLRACLLA